MTKGPERTSDLGLRTSFVIRPSSFVNSAQPILAVLPLLAVAFAGSVDRPGQGGLLLAFGLALLWRPPAVGVLGRPLAGLAGGFLAWAALPLILPAAWFPEAAWRTSLRDDLAIPLPPTLSPQPWLTADALALLAAGLAFVWWAVDAAGTLPDRGRRSAARWFVLGAAGLAVTAMVCQRLGMQPPGWRQERGFGPFPNRNQFGNFLAVCALLALGAAHADLRARRWARAGGLAAVLAALSVGVFINFSRAGVAMLFGGAAAYGAWAAAAGGFGGRESGGRRRENNAGSGAARLAVAASVLALLLAGFFLVGGDTLNRFTGGGLRETAGAVTGDFRWKVQADALSMLRAMPFCGPGLGNFAALFPAFRDRTATAIARAVHPESDWLWLGAEMGWPALVFAAGGLGALLWRLRVKERGEEISPVRRAALVGLGAFILHSFVEVSTHRMGTMFPAALLYALALPAPAAGVERAGARWPFRLLGAGLATVGALWLRAAWTGADWPPGKLAADNLRAAGNSAMRARDPARAAAALARAAELRPLDWSTRYDLGAAELYAGRPEDARADFRRAREMEPLTPRLPANEVTLWLAEGRHPDLALAALEETFRRDPTLGAQVFGETLSRHGENPDLRPGLETLAQREPALEVAFLENVPPGEVWPWLDAVLAEDPELTRHAADPARLRRFLRQWARHGDPAELDAAMVRRPAWQAIGWREWAESRINAGDPLAGCRVWERFARRPELPANLREDAPPPPGPGPDPGALAAEFARAPGDFALGVRLFRAQTAARRDPEALQTLIALSRLPGAPTYLTYLEARLRMALDDGAGAVNAWERYLKASGQD